MENKKLFVELELDTAGRAKCQAKACNCWLRTGYQVNTRAGVVTLCETHAREEIRRGASLATRKAE